MSSPGHLRWVLDKVKGEEHVTFENFVRNFNCTERRLATRTYAKLIDSDEIRSRRREKLRESFNDFLNHRQEIFWSERRLEVSSEIVANDAGVSVKETGGVTSRDGFTQLLARKKKSK